MKNFDFAFFNTTPTPCYWLGADGTFAQNTAALHTDDTTVQAVRRLLEAHAADATAGAPEPAPARHLGDLSILRLPDGLLAIATENRELPADFLSAELRDPVSNIFAVMPLLSRQTDEVGHPYLQEIQNNCYQLLRLASNMESYVGAQSAPQTEAVDLTEFMAALGSTIKTACHRSGVPVECALPNSPLLVRASTRQLSDAVLNLVRNSLQYTRDGNHITLRLQRAGRRAVLSVEDRGLGIKPAHLPHVFEPYYSVDPYGDSADRPGSGLGLALVREMAQNLGGTVAAESVFGEGTRITLALPLDAGGSPGALRSDPADYLMNRYSPVYIQLAGYCTLPHA